VDGVGFRFRMIMNEQTSDGGELTVGDTVVPMYVDQSRDELQSEKTVGRALDHAWSPIPSSLLTD
jgi:ATPase subunit of ABC transporter with duplicated ATPase domains